MKVIKHGLFMLVILLFGLGSVRSALATVSACDNGDEQPANGAYGFTMQGSNVAAPKDIPTTAMSGVFTTALGAGNTFFNVSLGSFILNDDGSICTGTFTGTGGCQQDKVTAGFMDLTLGNLVDVTPGGCATIDAASPTGALTLQYGLFNSESAMFLMDTDTDTYSIVGEGQHQ
jgi:hypothetical protein